MDIKLGHMDRASDRALEASFFSHVRHVEAMSSSPIFHTSELRRLFQVENLGSRPSGDIRAKTPSAKPGSEGNRGTDASAARARLHSRDNLPGSW